MRARFHPEGGTVTRPTRSSLRSRSFGMLRVAATSPKSLAPILFDGLARRKPARTAPHAPEGSDASAWGHDGERIRAASVMLRYRSRWRWAPCRPALHPPARWFGRGARCRSGRPRAGPRRKALGARRRRVLERRTMLRGAVRALVTPRRARKADRRVAPRRDHVRAEFIALATRREDHQQ